MRRGRGKSSGAGRGGSSFVRRKKPGCPPRDTDPAKDVAGFFPLRVRAISLRLWVFVFRRLTRGKDLELPAPKAAGTFAFPNNACCRSMIAEPLRIPPINFWRDWRVSYG